MIAVNERELKRAISYLKILSKRVKLEGNKTENLDKNIEYLWKEYEEQRSLNREETNEMLEWALNKTENK